MTTTSHSLAYRTILAAMLFLLSTQANGSPALNKSYEVGVDGIACPFCAYGVEKQLDKIGDIVEMDTDIKAGIVRVTVEGGSMLDEKDVRTAVEKAGFSLRDFKESGSE